MITIELETKTLPKFSKNLMKSTFNNMVELDLIMKSNPRLTMDIPELIKNFGDFPLLSLEFCEINANSKNIFNEMRRFEILYLESCSLKIPIPPDFLKSQIELKYLVLYYNEIKELPTQIFSELKWLEILNLAKNKITSLAPDLFNMNVNLESLSLYENEIKILPENIFSTLKKLKQLYLNQNQIEIIPQKLLVNNLELEEFYMWGNKVKRILVDFKTLPRLTELFMSYNECCVALNDCDFKSKEEIQKNHNSIKQKCG